jgi:hypothetical protein
MVVVVGVNDCGHVSAHRERLDRHVHLQGTDVQDVASSTSSFFETKRKAGSLHLTQSHADEDKQHECC